MLTKADKQKAINDRLSAFLQRVVEELHGVEGGTKVISASTEQEQLFPAGFQYNVRISVQLSENKKDPA